MIKQYSKTIINVMLIAIVLYGAGRLYFQMTAGFMVSNITGELPRTKSFKQDINHLVSVNTVLKQPYTYLGKGCQSYVFLSEDKGFVIKFLKFQRFRPSIYQEILGQVPGFEAGLEKKRKEKMEKTKALFKSWELAFTKLPKETGLLHLHLNQEPGLISPIKIVDKLGLSHEIDSNEVVFLLQKRALPLETALHKMMAKGRRRKLNFL